MSTFNGEVVKQLNYFWGWYNNEWKDYTFSQSMLNDTTNVTTFNMTRQIPLVEGQVFPIAFQTDLPTEPDTNKWSMARIISKIGNTLELRIKVPK